MYLSDRRFGTFIDEAACSLYYSDTLSRRLIGVWSDIQMMTVPIRVGNLIAIPADAWLLLELDQNPFYWPSGICLNFGYTFCRCDSCKKALFI